MVLIIYQYPIRKMCENMVMALKVLKKLLVNMAAISRCTMMK